MSDILESTPAELTSLPLIYRGKVRDVYGIDDRHILIVATDRLSAFDVVLPSGIPGKGAMLTTAALVLLAAVLLVTAVLMISYLVPSAGSCSTATWPCS